jgi:Leucine-rich repeat (LRR) protein
MNSKINYFDLELIIKNCEKIKILNLHGSRDLWRLPSSLKNLTNLMCLDMCWSRLNRSSLQHVGEIKSLVFLFMCHCCLTDISFIYNLVNLESVNIRGNRLCLTSGIRNLRNLYSLDISYNSIIRDISCLKGMNLEKLYISGTSIRNMEVIKSLSKLNLLGFRDIILNSRESIIDIIK